jgi:hypothetical protein
MEKARKETMNAALMSKLSVEERANLTKVFAGMEELPAEAQGDLKQALMQELTGGTITNPLVASNQELAKYVKETAARMRAGGENVTADQLKAGRALAQTIDAQNKAGAGIGAATAQVALFGGATSDVVSKQSAAATAFSEMASRTDPEGITQSQRAIKEAAKLGKTSKYRIQNFPEFEKSFEDVLAQFGFAQSRQAIIKEEIGEQNYKVLQQIKQMTNQKGIQARMAYELKIN